MKKKTLFHEETNHTDAIQQNAEYSRVLIQNSIDVWAKISNRPICKIETIQSFLTNGRIVNGEAVKNQLFEDYLFNQESTKIAGLELNKEKLKELIVLPDFTPMIEVLNKFMEHIPHYQDSIYWEFFEIFDQKVLIIQDKVEERKNMHRFFTDGSDESNGRLQLVLGICEGLNKVAESIAHTTYQPIALEIPGICFWDSRKKTMTPSPV